MIEARPQSGFYVARRPPAVLQRPAVSKPPRQRRRRRGLGPGARISWNMRPIRGWCRSAAPSRAPSCWRPGGSTASWRARRASRAREHNIYTDPKGEPRAAPGDRAPRAALGTGAVAGRYRHHLRLHRSADRWRLRAVTRPGDTWRSSRRPISACCTCSRRSGSRRSSCRPTSTSGIDLAGAGEGARSASRSAHACSRRASTIRSAAPCRTTKKRAVLDLLAQHDVPLIEDDIYGDIYFGPERPRPFMALDRDGRHHLLQLVLQDRSRRAIASAGSSPGATCSKRARA